MSQQLKEIRDFLKGTLDIDDFLAYSLVECGREGCVRDSRSDTIPLWMLRKERLRRGTGIPVDLGLSVLWSSRNVGAVSGEQPGYYVGWADPSGKKTSVRNEDYPSSEPPCDIDGTEYDMARQMWKETWRIPTVDEMRELIQNCRWFWTVIKGVPGYQVMGSTGNSIFLPAAGNRYGAEYEDAYYYGKYWTASRSEKNSKMACMLEFSQQGIDVGIIARCTGLCIRPVLEKND